MPISDGDTEEVRRALVDNNRWMQEHIDSDSQQHNAVLQMPCAQMADRVAVGCARSDAVERCDSSQRHLLCTGRDGAGGTPPAGGGVA